MNTLIAELKELPASLRPREILQAHGASYLSDRQLLAVLLGSGTKGRGVFSLAQDVLEHLESSKFQTDLESLTAIPGLGKAKAGLIMAAFEFTRRCLHPVKKKITSPSDIYPLVSHYGDRRQEYFLSISLNGAHEVLAVRVVSMGLVNRAILHPRLSPTISFQKKMYNLSDLILVNLTFHCTFLRLHFSPDQFYTAFSPCFFVSVFCAGF